MNPPRNPFAGPKMRLTSRLFVRAAAAMALFSGCGVPGNEPGPEPGATVGVPELSQAPSTSASALPDTARVPAALAEFCAPPSASPPATTDGDAVAVGELMPGTLFRPVHALRCVVRTYSQWERLRSDAGEDPAKENGATPVTRSTFQDSVVIVASMGEQETSGYSIVVDDVRTRSGQLIVTVRSYRTSEGTVSPTFTHPVAIVRMVRPAGAVRFIER